MKIKKGDKVTILIGKDKGKTSTVVRVLPKNNAVVVENMNQYKRHMKSRSRDQKSEIITITKPLPISNVAIICSKCKKTTRVGYTIRNEKKVRVCKKCDETID